MEKLYGFFSQKSLDEMLSWQQPLNEDRHLGNIYLDLSGKEVHVTEVNSKKEPDNFHQDNVYLGVVTEFVRRATEVDAEKYKKQEAYVELFYNEKINETTISTILKELSK